jgi:hypothetical protein
MDEAPKSYRERQKEARAIARAKREATEAALRKQRTILSEARRMALQLAKDEIRASGKKWTDYSALELRQRAEGYEGPWLLAKAQARVEQILQHSCKPESPVVQGVLMHETHARNGAAR